MTPDGQSLQKGPIAWMARNSVVANLVMWAILIGGVMSLSRIIKKEVFPEFDLDIISISVPYPGASPEEVEQGIILAVEEAVSDIDGVKEITATAGEGRGSVTVELLQGADQQAVYQDVKQQVDRISTFPDDAEEPRVVLAKRRREVVELVLYGDKSEWVLHDTAANIRDQLLQDPSITQVDLDGVRDYEIKIEISRDSLRKYKLTLSDVARRISSLAAELPGGGIKTQGGEILLRVRDRRDYADEFAEIPIISTADGSQVRLGDIATVTDDFEESDRYATYNGKRAVMIEIFRIGDQSPTQVSDAVRAKLVDINEELPPSVTLSVRRDMSNIYRQRAELLLRNGFIGLILVLCLLGFFLELRLAFWVMMGIPISFLGGMLLMPSIGLTINMITMFAFLIALGIVVDDAIVVGENIHERQERGVPGLKAAILGTREVAVPVVFSILTNVVTFLPLMFVPGRMGKIFRNIPLIVVSVFILSLFECLFILPAHLAHSKRAKSAFGKWLHSLRTRFTGIYNLVIRKVYGPILHHSLRGRYLTVCVGIAILIATIGMIRSKYLGMDAMPRVESDYAVVSASLPYGTAVEKTEVVRDRLVAAAQRVAEQNGGDKLLVGVFATLGRAPRGQIGGSHSVEVRAYMTDPDMRPISTTKFAKAWRKEVGQIAGLKTLLFESDRGGPGGGASLSIQLSHRDTATLEAACQDLAGILEEFPVVKDVDDGFMPGKVQYDLKIRPEGQALGLTTTEIGRQIRNSFYGAKALSQQRGRNEVTVRVKLPKSQRISEYDIEQFLVRTPAGADVPLREVAEFTRGRAYTRILRRDGARNVTVTANVDPPKESGKVLDTVLSDHMPELKARYPGLSYGLRGRQQDFRDGMKSLLVGFLVAIVAIYVLLAIPFKSYVQPLIVMISIPFGIVGAVIGHWIMGYSLSMISMMGIVALSGVVVNDSLVLIDYANRQRAAGKSVFEAVWTAGLRRFRPIFLTTMTTFGGLAPMIWETSRQARFMIPMAISLGFGILFATAITLMLVPSLYLIIEDVRKVFGWIMRRPVVSSQLEYAEQLQETE